MDEFFLPENGPNFGPFSFSGTAGAENLMTRGKLEQHAPRDSFCGPWALGFSASFRPMGSRFLPLMIYLFGAGVGSALPLVLGIKLRAVGARNHCICATGFGVKLLGN